MITSQNGPGNGEDLEYAHFIERLQQRLAFNTDNGARPLFTTDVGDTTDLWDIYLGAFPEGDVRQFHNCSACRKFIETYGALVVIEQDGTTKSAFWWPDDAPEFYWDAIHAVRKRVERAKVTGVFLTKEAKWGTPVTGPWTHMALTHPGTPFKDTLLTAGQKMAERMQDFITVNRALHEFKLEQLSQIVALLEADTLYRSEKVLGPAKWLYDVSRARSLALGGSKIQGNVLWLAIATAPAGFCHPRSSMIGTLLDDISNGYSWEQVAARFKQKMHPLQYQRPSAAPSEGAIKAAEAIVEKMKAAGSLQRRFARLEDLELLWQPVIPEATVKIGGVFAHLKPKGQHALGSLRTPPQPITWAKFQRTVLPQCETLEVLAPSHGPFTSLVTAVNPDSPPIFQWDSEERRNQVSWYFWHGGASASQFGLQGDTFYPVSGITLKPSLWHNSGIEQHGVGVFFLIAGAMETRFNSAAIFPECLRSEFHGVRKVIEAYSRSTTIQEPERQTAAGLGTDFKSGYAVIVRVKSAGALISYKLDRWD